MARATSNSTRIWLGRGLLVLGLFMAIVIGAKFASVNAQLQNLLRWISDLGFWAPVIFIVIYAVSCILFVPASILTLGAGFIFGVAEGSFYVLIGATFGAGAAFLLGRYAAKNWIAQFMARHPKFKAIDEAVAKEGWKIVGLARLSPVFPFNVLNYVFALTQISFRDFIWASVLGVLPATVLYVYIGDLAGDLTKLGKSGFPTSTSEWVLYAGGLATTVGVTIYITRLSKKALDERFSDEWGKSPGPHA